MLKNNIRSIRFSDELMEIINQQVGENFNQKFERLVYNCYMVLPEREKQIKNLDALLKGKREDYAKLRDQYVRLMRLLNCMENQLSGVFADPVSNASLCAAPSGENGFLRCPRSLFLH